MSSTITLEVEDLVTLVSNLVSEALTPLLSQQPQAVAPAKRSAKPKAAPKSKSKASRSAKPVSTAQHAKGSVIEVAFGIRADGSLTKAQQQRAEQFFADHDVVLKSWTGVITVAAIVQGITCVNAALRGGNESTVRYWAVFNGPKGIGRLSDVQVRTLLRNGSL